MIKNNENWAVETADGTEVASGMTREQAEERANELRMRTGREYYATLYIPTPTSDLA